MFTYKAKGVPVGANLKISSAPITFRRKQRHECAKLLNSLTAESQDAIEVLVALLKSADEKTRMAAADKLLTFQVQIAENINRDSISRLLLEIKHGKSDGDFEADDTPTICFDEIQSV